MAADTFTCEQCGGTFAKARPDAEALAESRARFGDRPPADLAVVCDDCFWATAVADAVRRAVRAEREACAAAASAAVQRLYGHPGEAVARAVRERP